MERGAKNGNFSIFLGKARMPCIYRARMRGSADQKGDSAKTCASCAGLQRGSVPNGAHAREAGCEAAKCDTRRGASDGDRLRPRSNQKETRVGHSDAQRIG